MCLVGGGGVECPGLKVRRSVNEERWENLPSVNRNTQD